MGSRDTTVESPHMTETEARAAIDAVRADVDSLVERLNELWARRAWLALGYASWGDMCAAELPGRQLPRTERPAAAGELRAAGMSTRAIGEAFDVSHVQVQRDLREVEHSVPAGVTGKDGKLYPTTARSEDAALADRIKALDPERVRELLLDDEEEAEDRCWTPSGLPVTLDALAVVVVADVDYRGRGDADVFGPFPSLDEARAFAVTVPNEPTCDAGYPPVVQVLAVTDLCDPAGAHWFDSKEG